jgi:hypothetical protein
MMISLAKLLVLPSSVFLLVIPITLSAVTHLWNPIGFPAIYMDEDIYLARTLHLLNGLGPQMGSLYDHPYFGWLFLGSILKLINYPHSFVSSIGEDSIQMLYFVPRVVAGVLAVIDTFLIYKISELRYNKTAAFIASILFGVMPMTWITRWILLDTIQLPFILSSILFSL